jgi:hypothetical protein
MALVLADRVRDTTTTTGTGTVTLSGTAPTGYQNFSVIGNGNTCYYTINAGSQWEVGIGTYSSTGPTLSRDTVLSSSSSGSLVDFSAGTKDVFVTYPSGESVYQDGTAIKAGTAILGVTNGGTGTNTTFTSGSVVFSGASGVYSQDNANLFWDNTNDRLGIGNTAPGYKLEVTGDIRTGSGGDLRLGSATGTTTSAGDSSIFNDANDMYLNTGNVTRMYIANGGNVGIGNTGPTYRLDVSAADTTAGLGYAMRIRANATAAGGAFQFTDSGATTQWGFLAATATSVTLDASGASVLAFRTNSAERMRITSGGDVGIGTTPVQQNGRTLQVDGGAGPADFRLTNNATGAAINNGGLYSLIGVDNYLWNLEAGFLSFGTSNAERMRIDSSGNVGVGTSTVVGGRMQVSGQTSDTDGAGLDQGQLLITDSDNNTTSGLMVGYRWNAGVAEYGRIQCRNAVGATNLIVQAAGGNVGIGTNDPAYKLEVKGSPAWIRNFSGAASSPGETQDWPVAAFNVASFGDFSLQTMMAFTLPNDGNYFLGYDVWNFKLDQTGSSTTSAGVNGMQFGGPGYLSFMPGTNEKARITSGGALLVGTTSPLAGNTSSEYKTTVDGLWPLTLNANNRGLLVRHSAASSGIYAYFEYNGGTNNGQISWSGGTTSYVTTSDARVKKNIVDAPDAGALIDAIKVRSWDFKVDDMHWRYGMVAQELLPIAPEAVTVPEDEEKMMGIDYSKLVPMLIKEVQSLRTRLALLEGK